jgi:hypothetical protein
LVLCEGRRELSLSVGAGDHRWKLGGRQEKMIDILDFSVAETPS